MNSLRTVTLDNGLVFTIHGIERMRMETRFEGIICSSIDGPGTVDDTERFLKRTYSGVAGIAKLGTYLAEVAEGAQEAFERAEHARDATEKAYQTLLQLKV